MITWCGTCTAMKYEEQEADSKSVIYNFNGVIKHECFHKG